MGDENVQDRNDRVGSRTEAESNDEKVILIEWAIKGLG